MKRFKVTYTNLNKGCSMTHNITKSIFADNEDEALQFCDDLYNDCNGHFRVLDISQEDNK